MGFRIREFFPEKLILSWAQKHKSKVKVSGRVRGGGGLIKGSEAREILEYPSNCQLLSRLDKSG